MYKHVVFWKIIETNTLSKKELFKLIVVVYFLMMCTNLIAQKEKKNLQNQKM